MQTSGHAFGKATSNDASLGTQLKIQLLESSLSKLFECLARECSCRKLVHPQWKHFKSMKLAFEDRIRLNNALWRCWHIQYLKGKRPKFCAYVTPMMGESHSRSRAVVLEGKYWRRRLEAVASEYKNWRIFYKDRVRHLPSQCLLQSETQQADGQLRHAEHVWPAREVKTEPNTGTSNETAVTMPSALDEQDMQLLSSYSDTLFSSLVTGNQNRFEDYGAYANIMQPAIGTVQHSFHDLLGFDIGLDNSGGMGTMMAGDSIWKDSAASSPAVAAGLPLTPLAMEHRSMHTGFNPSTVAAARAAAGPTPSASSLNSMSDSAGSDAHMAAQQLIMLMSSGKEAEGGTLKQLQMLLQSAANSTNTSTPTLSSTPPSAVPPQPLRPSLQATSATATSAAAPIPSSVRLSPPHMRMGATLAPGEPMTTGSTLRYETLSSQIPNPMPSSATQQSQSIAGASSMLASGSNQSSSSFQASSGGNFEAQAMSLQGSDQASAGTPIKTEKAAGGSQVVGKEERRKLHITAEQKRRVHIRNGFDELQALVPSVSSQSTKISKAVLLQKSVEHMRHLQQEKKSGEEEMEQLRTEIAQLNENIMQCQEQLPVTGAPITRSRLDQTQQLFDHYVNIRTQSNYKFWIFSMIVRSLFDAYNNSVSTANEDEMCRSVLTWFDHHCSLRALRPAVLTSLRQLSTSTSILSDSSKLPAEATSAAAAAAGATSQQSANAAAAAAANAATVAALASTFQNPYPQQQQQQQQQRGGPAASLLQQHMPVQQQQQQQQQASQSSSGQFQMNYFADGGLPFPNPSFR